MTGRDMEDGRGGTDGGRRPDGAPLLTIGIIFKNEIRCIRRCLDSLRPLREAVPCKLVMADTGSTDGSRAVAERYADELFDFPWVDDFSAARNALLDRAAGRWYLTIDCDEWLDPDISALAALVREQSGVYLCLITQRNYENPNFDDSFSDVLVGRLFTRTPEGGFEGAIHEQYRTHSPETTECRVPDIILHHDGYVNRRWLDPSDSRGSSKKRYYQRLLREELRQDPENLFRLYELLDSTDHDDPAWPEDLRRTLDLVEHLREQEAAGVRLARKNDWRRFGPPIFCIAVQYGCEKNLPELPIWAARAEKLFPASFFVRMDGNALLTARAWLSGDMEEAVRRGEAYLDAWEAFQSGAAQREQADGAFLRGSPYWRRQTTLMLAAACAKTGRTARALELLESVPFAAMDRVAVWFALEADAALYVRGVLEGGTLAAALWDDITSSASSETMAEERRTAFLAAGEKLLEEEDRDACLPMFLPLAGRCPLGDAAAREEELRQLAEQVRTILSLYPEDDPAVLELKRSPIYQRVARFIEET